MSYDIDWKVKVQGSSDLWVSVGAPTDCNITWNVREMIVKSTGLDWNNEEDNGLVKDVIPKIQDGLANLTMYPNGYRHLESKNGWGTVESTKEFFVRLITEWNKFCNDYSTSKLKDYVHFWIT